MSVFRGRSDALKSIASGFHPGSDAVLAGVIRPSGYFPATDAPSDSRALSDMTTPHESPPPTTPTFRKNLIRVLATQVGGLLLLWLLQSRYSG